MRNRQALTISGIPFILAAALALAPLTVAANDSTATLGAGGLELQKSAEVAILSEKLFISPARITVDYEMKNIGKEPVETVVAFPLPRLSAPDMVNIPIETDREHPDNFVNFSVTVDGKAVAAEKEIRAYSIEENGAEVTDKLAKAHILTPPVAKDFYRALETLPEADEKILVDAHLLEIERYEGEVNYTPLWETQITYHWKQRFEPGAVLRVHHEYHPVVGRGLFGEYSFIDDGKSWCIDPGTDKAIRTLLKKQPKPADSETYLDRKQVDYVLSTGGNWAGPIRSFELTIEKETAEQVVSLCLEGLKKASPTQFKLAATDFIPKKDLSIIFVGPRK